jgi:sugar lactone lactonase YvrE
MHPISTLGCFLLIAVALGLTPSGSATQAAEPDRVFVGLYFSGTVDEVLPDGTLSTFATGLGYPEGMAFDPTGNLYVANYGGSLLGAGSILKISPSGTVSTLASGLSQITALTLDTAGNVYACNEGAGKVYKITPAGSVSVFASPNLGDLEGLAFDRAGNLYCSSLTGPIDEITPSGAISQFVSSPSMYNVGLAFDAQGNLYDSGYGEVYKISPSGSTTPFASAGYGFPAFDSAGNLLVTSQTGVPGTISRITPAATVSTFKSGIPGLTTGIAIQPAPEPSTALLMGITSLPLLATRMKYRGLFK